MKKRSILTLALFLFLPSTLAQSDSDHDGIIVGVNLWNEGFISPAARDAEIKEMAKDGVKVIRTGLGTSTEFLKQAYQNGIRCLVWIEPTFGSKAKAQGRWSRLALSEADPEGFKQAFKPLLDQLDTAGVRLAGIEVGNEINTSGYNADIPIPGSGRVLGVSDLNNPGDAEAHAIANGYQVYIKILAALKELRDRSKFNQHTPIITAGLAAPGRPASKAPSWAGGVAISLADTIELFRRNGADHLVDAYGVHVYPDGNPHKPVEARIASLGQDIFSMCTPAKPCWLTEWGIPNGSQTCPIDETSRTLAIQSVRAALKHFVEQRQLAAVLYYDWLNIPGQKAESYAIFRCGALTEAGKVALSPMQ